MKGFKMNKYFTLINNVLYSRLTFNTMLLGRRSGTDCQNQGKSQRDPPNTTGCLT